MLFAFLGLAGVAVVAALLLFAASTSIGLLIGLFAMDERPENEPMSPAMVGPRSREARIG